MAVGLFAVAALAAASPTAAASSMTDFVDCSDDFWRVVCQADVGPADEPDVIVGEANIEPANEPDVVVGEANVEPANEPDVVVGELIRIDNDPVCTEIDNGYIICHT